MSIQLRYTIIFVIFTVFQILCAINALKSKKEIGKYTSLVNIAIIIPTIANIFIINTKTQEVANFGYYFSYVGMLAILLAIVYFTTQYCKGDDPTQYYRSPNFVYILGLIDAIQLALGPVFNHVFSTKATILENRVFFHDTTLLGLSVHRAITYSIYICILLVYFMCLKKASKLYKEKYFIIFYTLLISGIIQGIFIYSSIPIDKSIIIHNLFGFVIFYFAMIHRPLRLLDTLLSNVAFEIDDSIYLFDKSEECIWANEQGYRFANSDDITIVKENLFILFGEVVKHKGSWKEVISTRDDRHCILEKKAIVSDNVIEGSFLVVKDDTERYNIMERKKYESTHDSLTGLYNSQYLSDIMETILATEEKPYCLIYINIKNFKIVNDIFGRKFGDKTLKQLANWLRINIKGCVVARLTGDTFGIFMPAEQYNEELFLDGLSSFIVKDKKKVHQLAIHIGVYDNIDKSLDVSAMFDRAHLASSSIDTNYKTCISHYDDNTREQIIEEQALVLRLPKAIEENQIQPYFQPIMDKNKKLVGAEALARWVHPELGFLLPVKFISIFEKNGLIADLDRHAWRKSCELLAKWRKKYPDLFISINVSPIDFYYINVVEEVCSLIKEFKIDPSKLRIEITETAMMSEPEEKVKIFDSLRKEGFIVEVDDFGSGYSSLNLLKNMPVDVLKIDMNFLSIETNDKSDTILKNVINLSNELKITSLTEGVENEKQFNQLVDMGCSLFQGYYFSKPMSLSDFEQFIKENYK